MLEGIGLLNGIMAKMNWLDQNQRVLSENIANSDTPGYQPKTLKPVDFKSMLGASAADNGAASVKPVTITPVSLGGAGDTGKPSLSQTKQKAVYEVSPDNNGVVIEEQLFKANQNNIEYQLATDLYRRNIGMLRMVLQGSGR